MARPTIWTPSVRLALYERLTTVFGPYETWAYATRPGKDLNDVFEKFCTDFAATFGATSGEAVVHQIMFAIAPGPLEGGLNRNAILNKAAAFEAGFITNGHL